MYITIYSSTDLPQSDEKQKCADDRSEAIRKQLMEQGIDPERIVTANLRFNQTTTKEVALYEVIPGLQHYNIPYYPAKKL